MMILGGSNNQSKSPEIETSSSAAAVRIVKLNVKFSSSSSHLEIHLHQCQLPMKNQTAPMAEQSNHSQSYQITIRAILYMIREEGEGEREGGEEGRWREKREERGRGGR